MKKEDGMVILAFIVLSSLPGPILMFIKRKNKVFHTPLSYFMGNRDLPPVATAISLFMSFSPLVLITDFPVEIYNRGASPFLRCIGQSVGVIIAASLFIPMLFRLKVVTTYEYVEKRYQTRALRFTSSAVAILISILNNALVTYSLCLSIVVVSPMPIWLAAILVTVKATFSAGAGGIQSVVWTNVIHFLTMFICLSAVVAMSFKNFDQGASDVFSIANEGGRLNFLGHSLDPRDDFTIWTALFPAIFHYIGLFFSQTALSRYASFPPDKMGRCVGAALSVIPQTIALHVLLLFLAVSMYAGYATLGCDPIGLKKPYTTGLSSHFIKDFMEEKYPGIVGAWMVTLMASTLSTLSAGVNATVGLIWHDFIGDFLEHKFETKPKKLGTFLKLVTIFIGLISLSLALLMWRMPPGYVKLIAKVTLILSSAFYLLHIAGALVPFINRPGVISAITIAFALTTSLAVCQFYYGFAEKPARLSAPRQSCAAMLANMTRTTSACNYTSMVTTEATLSKQPRIAAETFKTPPVEPVIGQKSSPSTIRTSSSTSKSTSTTSKSTTRTTTTTTSRTTTTSTTTKTTSTTTTTSKPSTSTSTNPLSTIEALVSYSSTAEADGTSSSTGEATKTETSSPTTTTTSPSTRLTTTTKRARRPFIDFLFGTDEDETTTESISLSSKTSSVSSDDVTVETSDDGAVTRVKRAAADEDDAMTTVLPAIKLQQTTLGQFNRSMNGTKPNSMVNRRGAHLPPWFQYILSISFFFYPIFTIVFGFILALFISMCTGGLTKAKTVGAETLSIPNCFADAPGRATNPTEIAETEMPLLKIDNSAVHQPYGETTKNRRYYQSANEYARSVDPSTPAMMLDAAASSGAKNKNASNPNLIASMTQAPAVSIYGPAGGATATSRFTPVTLTAQNAGYQQLPLAKPPLQQDPDGFYDEEDRAGTEWNSSGTPDSEVRAASTFHHHR